MKKSLFAMGILAMAVASCTNEEVVDIPSSKGISFNNPYVGTSVRAVDAIETNLGMLQKADSGFYVYGGYETVTDVFKNTRVHYSQGKWIYEPLSYWVSGETYKFAAYTPDVNVDPSFDYTNGNLTFTNLIVDGTPTNQVDLVVGKSNPITAEDDMSGDDKKVKFTLRHALSMIKVTLTDGFRPGVKCDITNFAINNIKTKATFTQDAVITKIGTWSAWGEAETTSSFKDNGVLLGANNVTEYVNEFIVIPQSLASDGSITVTFDGALFDENDKPIEVKDGVVDGKPDVAEGADIVKNKKSFTIQIPQGEWAVNSRYHYKATIDGNTFGLNQIIFDEPTIEDWGAYTDTPVTIK